MSVEPAPWDPGRPAIPRLGGGRDRVRWIGRRRSEGDAWSRHQPGGLKTKVTGSTRSCRRAPPVAGIWKVSAKSAGLR